MFRQCDIGQVEDINHVIITTISVITPNNVGNEQSCLTGQFEKPIGQMKLFLVINADFHIYMYMPIKL